MQSRDSREPRPKVAAAGIAGVVVTVIVALTGWEPDAELVAAIVTLVSFGAGYLKRD